MSITGASRKQAGLYYDKGGAVFNVMHPDFGAKGDSVTDDTAAFALGMTAAAAIGGVLYVPAGNYIADPPNPAANVTMRGAGKNQTIINFATTSGRMLATDKDNITVEDITFVGKANSGASTTNVPFVVQASAGDVTRITVRRCAFRQFKAAAVIQIGGNGDLTTAATVNVNRIRIHDNDIIEFYDIDYTNLAQMATGIYCFGGVRDVWIENNYIEGSTGKHGIGVQTQGRKVTIIGNHCINCGSTNNTYGYGIFVYSGLYAGATVPDWQNVTIDHNIIVSSAKAGVYFAGGDRFSVSHNILDTCDTAGTAGLGVVGSGALNIQTAQDDYREGSGSVSCNQIINPALIGIYAGTGMYQRTSTTFSDNIITATTGQNLIGIVVNGRAMVFTGNQLRRISRNFYLYNTADNLVGDITISNNAIDATGGTSTTVGITVSDVTKLLGPMVVTGNRFKALTTGVDMRTVADLVFSGNQFAGVTTCTNLQGLVRVSITGNQADSGTTGLALTLKAATATARAVISGNSFVACTNPCTVTENTGQVIVKGNDFGTQPGIGANQGDNSQTFTEPLFEVYPFSTTLTANRTVTLAGGNKVYRGCTKRILRDAATPGAFTLAVVDGVGTITLYTIAANTKGFVDAIYDGTNWKLAGAGTFT